MLIALRYAEKEDWISDYDNDEAKDAVVFIITMMQLMLTMQIMMMVMMITWHT